MHLLSFMQNEEEEDINDDASDVSSSSSHDFNYILGMPLWNLTKEKKDELLKQRDNKVQVSNHIACDYRKRLYITRICALSAPLLAPKIFGGWGDLVLVYNLHQLLTCSCGG